MTMVILATELEKMLQAIINVTLDHPETVTFDLTVSPQMVLVIIKCSNRNECARLIGSGGETVRSMRRLIANGARRFHITNIIVHIVDPSGRHSGRAAIGDQL